MYKKGLRFFINRFGRFYVPIKVRFSKKFTVNKLLSQIILHMHSIEKGLSIKEPKLGFGKRPISKLSHSLHIYQNAGYDMNATPIQMAYGALASYIEFNKEQAFENETVKAAIKEHAWLQQFMPEGASKRGGFKTIKKDDMSFDIEAIEKMFMTRYSVREFTEDNVPEELIKNAINLAMRAPSACNRQAVRIYTVNKNKFPIFRDYLKNVGGFQNNLNKIMVITGQISSYSPSEQYQYIVSASVMAGYLSLTLHTYGIGACLMQCPVRYQKQIGDIAKNLMIPEDEQIICMIGIGMLKDSFKVPVSARLELEQINKFIV